MFQIPSPYIIIGMHRSGTSLVAKVLEKSGIFMGVIKDHNYEAMHFLSLNQQTLWAAGADWMEPKVAERIYWKTLPADVLFYEHFRTYGRWKKWMLRLKSPAWGWKDPRNTFTLPMWLEQYPNARVIHVVRNEADVVNSLSTRNHVKGEVHDPRLDDSTFNQNLWRDYVTQARSYDSQLKERFLEIRYEDLCSISEEAIGRLENFTGRKLLPLFREYVKS